MACTFASLAGVAIAQEATPSPAAGSPAPAPPPPAALPASGPKEPIVVRDHRTIRSYPANLGHNLVEVWTRPTLIPLLVGGATTASGFLLDDEAIRFFDRHPMRAYANVGRVLGTGVVATGVSTAILGVGRYANGDRFRAATYDMSQAVVVNFLYTLAVKEAVRRQRPDASDKSSFPSGHASNAFACATVWAEQYGLKGAIPGYLAAGLVAGSRLALKKHHLSDVVGGATLGYIVGKSVARWDAKPSRKPIPGQPKVGVGPDTALDGSGFGLRVTVRF
jgi:membrane-associated phospholipid phosphatase